MKDVHEDIPVVYSIKDSAIMASRNKSTSKRNSTTQGFNGNTPHGDKEMRAHSNTEHPSAKEEGNSSGSSAEEPHHHHRNGGQQDPASLPSRPGPLVARSHPTQQDNGHATDAALGKRAGAVPGGSDVKPSPNQDGTHDEGTSSEPSTTAKPGAAGINRPDNPHQGAPLMPRELARSSADETDATQVNALSLDTTNLRSFGRSLRDFCFGTPIQTENAVHERIGRFKALALLSSDALSSVAYGTEASLAVLVTAGLAATIYNLYIGLVIIFLLVVVVFSYRQTIMHYPTGGGSYIVASSLLSKRLGLVAAAALMIDYILTVSVSVSAGVDALVSPFSWAVAIKVPLGVIFIGIIVLVNLRGVRESGAIFAAPTYLFIGSFLLTIVVGVAHAALSHGGLLTAIPPTVDHFAVTDHLSVFLILTAFASGCSAMTGTEAIADGVPVFRGVTRRKQSENAAATLSIMALLLAIMYGGSTYLAWRFGITPNPNSVPTVDSQIAHLLYPGSWRFLYYIFQFATTLILILAANTSFSDFPRLSSILARDNYMPHIFLLRGGRLAFNTGILVLGILSSLLLVIFGGNTNDLINLYALGVFTAFTLSQSGMVARWRKEKEPGWQRGMVISGFGAIVTGLVTVIILISKAPRGAWVVVLLVVALIAMFESIHRHYTRVMERVNQISVHAPQELYHIAVVPIVQMNNLALRGLAYARSITPFVIALHVALDEKMTPEENEREEAQLWQAWHDRVKESHFLRNGPVYDGHSDEPQSYTLSTDGNKQEATGPRLVVIRSPLRQLVKPILAFLDKLHHDNPEYVISVVLPEYVTLRFWEVLLHNQTALWLKLALLRKSYIVTTNVPYRDEPAIKSR
jgi:amino acid transporter